MQIIAGRLKGCIRNNDTVARIGGDEFVLIITDVNSIESMTMVADKIIRVITQPVTLQQQEFYLTISLGISCYPEDGQAVEVLLKKTDIALY